MALGAGTRLGHYEICSQLGEGGMGEVYLAEDTRLHRKVALKILPADLASKQDRMRRFEQEATAAAALNHPNIAHIYEIGKSESVNFIAMEFIDGHTLPEIIHRGQTDLPKLLRYLQHTAEGLAKAHAAGIVHRDLKPDNVMITRDGHAKILDFGLAKLVESSGQKFNSEATRQELSAMPTAVMPQYSQPGTVLGTVGYMSPEQAQGRVNEIDHRSDIFSFGCILFEAATRDRAFEGKDPLDSLHNIVYAPTPQIRDLNPAAPDDLQRILRRCLAKDPDERYQSIKDAAIEIKDVRRDLAHRAGIETSTPAAKKVRLQRTVPRRLSARHRVHFQPVDPALSTDGRAIVYGITRYGVTNLWAQPIDGSAPKQLTNSISDRIFDFDFSRDGKRIAFSHGTVTNDVILISNFR
jgi:serine/threonine protein kinase